MSSTNFSRNDPTGYTGGFSSKAVMGSDAMLSVGLSRAFEYDDLRVICCCKEEIDLRVLATFVQQGIKGDFNLLESVKRSS